MRFFINAAVIILSIVAIIVSYSFYPEGCTRCSTIRTPDNKGISNINTTLLSSNKKKNVTSPVVTYNKHNKNPMNYTYNNTYGNYIDKLNSTHISQPGILKYPHFLKFPVKYYIECKAEDKAAIIKNSLKEFSDYFPVQPAQTKAEADLVITVIRPDKLKTSCPMVSVKNELGCGGGSYKTNKFDTSKSNYKANAVISEDAFNCISPEATIKHELGHAFGINNHSSEKTDLLFHEIECSDAGKQATSLTPADLNTLFLIYNNW